MGLLLLHHFLHHELLLHHHLLLTHLLWSLCHRSESTHLLLGVNVGWLLRGLLGFRPSSQTIKVYEVATLFPGIVVGKFLCWIKFLLLFRGSHLLLLLLLWGCKWVKRSRLLGWLVGWLVAEVGRLLVGFVHLAKVKLKLLLLGLGLLDEVKLASRSRLGKVKLSTIISFRLQVEAELLLCVLFKVKAE